MEQTLLILSQVCLKEFVNTEKRLPESDEDSVRISTAMLKTYKAYLLASDAINKFKK